MFWLLPVLFCLKLGVDIGLDVRVRVSMGSIVFVCVFFCSRVDEIVVEEDFVSKLLSGL